MDNRSYTQLGRVHGRSYIQLCRVHDRSYTQLGRVHDRSYLQLGRVHDRSYIQLCRLHDRSYIQLCRVHDRSFIQLCRVHDRSYIQLCRMHDRSYIQLCRVHDILTCDTRISCRVTIFQGWYHESVHLFITYAYTSLFHQCYYLALPVPCPFHSVQCTKTVQKYTPLPLLIIPVWPIQNDLMRIRIPPSYWSGS